MLLLCTARPELQEQHPTWAAGLRNATTINLPPLSDRETAELVSHLIATTVLSEERQQAVLERAGGNPLYAEEFVRLLADRGLGAAEMELPESLQALIAARLDTLSPERKSLLQDAAVVGQGVLGGRVGRDGRPRPARGRAGPARACRARSWCARPGSSLDGRGRPSTASGTCSCATSPTARSRVPARAARHRAAAAWIERQAGERVEDLADVLAHHYLRRRSSCAEAAGDSEQAAELAVPARRFLALAGERALGLDTAQAEAQLARALALCPADDPGRPELLIRWAEAAEQAGQPREAAAALEEALAAFRARGEREAEARALILLARVTFTLGEGRHVVLAAEAVALLELEPPGPTLVSAYTQLAAAHFLTGAYGEAIAAAERAVTLAKRLGLPEPVRALGARGMARATRGDPDGLAEMERALLLLIEEGAGYEVAALQNNLAIARYPFQGPARSLADFEEGIAFCEQRGLASQATWLEGDCPSLLVELGRPEEALDLAGRVAAADEARGGTSILVWVRSPELAIHLARGESDRASRIADWLVEATRAQATPDLVAEALPAAAAARLAAGTPDQARALLAEVEQTPGARATPYYSRQLAAMLRTALAAGDLELARRLTDGLEPRDPLREHALCACRAQLAEAAGEQAEAAERYAEAAERWLQFGNAPERAYALLGQGRCLIALRRPAAEVPLAQARELFASMGYKPALAETEALLQQTTAAAS